MANNKLIIIRLIGVALIIVGFGAFRLYGGTSGVATSGLFAAVAYIGGPILAAIGAYLLLLFGRKRVRDSQDTSQN